MASHWLKPFIPYTLSKYGMTLLALGLAEELRGNGISSSTLWPQTAIATAAIKFALDDDIMKKSRTPRIMADASLEIIKTENLERTGQTIIDEGILREMGITDFDQYKYDSDADELMRDLFLDSDF
jgi:citronellol/citronellal dehydrogenase